ncbi:MAG: hypothetical protein AAF492_33530, partial [Verrucomicrobiota bacterium]
SVEIPMTLRNTGGGDAHNVTATLTTSDPYVTMTDDSVFWGTIAAGATLESIDFDFDVAANCPPGRIVAFNLTITSDEGTWTGGLTMMIGVSLPSITYEGHRIDDDAAGGSNGDGDGVPEPGESIEMPMTLSNSGPGDAHNVTATVTTTDPYITITDGSVSWGTLVAGTTVEGIDFDFDVAANTPPGHIAAFSLTINSDEITVTGGLTILIGSGSQPPVMAYQSHRIDDDTITSNGNDDGEANPGERIELPVTLINTGAGDANNVNATLSTSDPYISITDSDVSWGTIPAGTSEESIDFDFDVAANCPAGRVVIFTLNITSDEVGLRPTGY